MWKYFTVIFLSLALQASCSDEPNSKSMAATPAPTPSGAVAQVARFGLVTVDETTDSYSVDLSRRVVPDDLNAIPEELDGVILSPGTELSELTVRLPRSVVGNLGTRGTLSSGFELIWRHAESPTDSEHDLCKISTRRNSEGDAICGVRWVTEVYAAGDDSANIQLNISRLEATPGGKVRIEVAMPTYRKHDFDGGEFVCCGRARAALDAVVDDVGRTAPADMQAWMVSEACGRSEAPFDPETGNCVSEF
jgi:hypothetical protein